MTTSRRSSAAVCGSFRIPRPSTIRRGTAARVVDDRATDVWRQVAFPRPGWAEKERVLALRDEAPRRQLVDQRAIHLLVEIKVKVVEGRVRVAKPRLFVLPLEQAVLSTQE